ncbi:MAG: SDR family NAD(P)-dependent oxidoreductase [Chitinophagaceae bacterium]
MNSSKKKVLITGGSRGIGAATVNHFLNLGHHVAVLDISNGSYWQKDPIFIPCDVADETAVNSAVEAIVTRWGQIDILVNNAGIQRYGTVLETSSEVWDEVMNVNLKSMFLCSKAVLPTMIEAGAGVIVNVASVQAFHSQPRVAAYTTSKSAILGLTRSIAVDYAPAIRCVAICPGTIDTEMLRESISLSPNPEEVLRECEQMHLSHRIGKPDEVAAFIEFLSSDKAGFATGQAYRVDGGLGIVIQGSLKS